MQGGKVIYGPDGKPVSSPRNITGWVKKARFYPKERSLVLILEETTTRKPLPPAQLSASLFPFGHIDEAMHEFAKKLEQRTTPITVTYDPAERLPEGTLPKPEDLNMLEVAKAMDDYYADRARRKDHEDTK